MTPPHFQIGQEVEVTGPDSSGTLDWIGEKFKIVRNVGNENQYYTAFHVPLFPASSLRLVEEALKIGDYAEVLVDGCGVKKGTIIKISKVLAERIPGDRGPYYTADKMPLWPSHELRKLTPDEIKQHTTVSGIHGKYANIDARLSAIEKRQDRQTEASDILAQRLTEQRRSLDLLAPSHAELLGDVEALAEKVGDIGKQQKEMWERHDINRERLDEAEDKISAIEKQLAKHDREIGQSIEQGNKNIDGIRVAFKEIKERLAILEGERPEVCDGKRSSLLSQRDYILHRIADDMMLLLDENFITDSNMRAREHVWLGELEAVNERLDSTREA